MVMKHLRPAALAALLLILFWVPSSSAQTPTTIQGDWAGGSDLFQTPAFLYFRFAQTESGLNGLTNVQAWRVFNRALTNVRFESSQVHFEFPSTTGVPFVGDGELKTGVIQGTIRRGEQKGKFHLIRLAKVDRLLYDKYVGAYRFSDPKQAGRTKLGLVTYGALGHLRFVDSETGSTQGLFPLSEDKFFFASAVAGSPSPDVATWSFAGSHKGEVTASIVRIKGQPDQTGARTELYMQDRLHIRSGNALLAATLVLPGTKGKHPVVVFVPGSQALSRDESAPFREFDALISNGIGILIYDKRGTGESTGDWQQESFEGLADDALAAVALLKKRRDINPQQIGVWGFSQGANIAPLVASRSRSIAFVIMTSGGAITPREAEMNEQLARMRAQKMSEEEMKEAVAFMRLQFDAVRSQQGWERFQATIPQVREKKWYRYTWGGLPRDYWQWKWWVPIVDFDPIPLLKQVKVPVLAMFGAADQFTPPEIISGFTAKIEAALRAGGNRDVTTKIFANADHDISVKLENGQWAAPPDYHSTLVHWILQRTMPGIRAHAVGQVVGNQISRHYFFLL
jgi:pimeloyl-ACP methyl ester carboxylesterase